MKKARKLLALLLTAAMLLQGVSASAAGIGRSVQDTPVSVEEAMQKAAEEAAKKAAEQAAQMQAEQDRKTYDENQNSLTGNVDKAIDPNAAAPVVPVQEPQNAAAQPQAQPQADPAPAAPQADPVLAPAAVTGEGRVIARVAVNWDDDNNRDGKRNGYDITLSGYIPSESEAVVVRHYHMTTAMASQSFSKQDDNTTNLFATANGETVSYTLTVDAAPEGYTAEVTGDIASGFTIKLTHEPERGTIVVHKAWNDEQNRDGKRPDYLEVKLNDGSADTTVYLTEAGGWFYAFEDLYKYEEGSVKTYTVSEVLAADSDYIADAESANASVGDTVEFVNTYAPESMVLTVNKVWEDSNNQDGKRPAQITLHIVAGGEIVATYMMGDEASHSFNLPKMKNGQPLHYVVVEEAVEGYTTSSVYGEPDAEGNVTVTITNKYEPDKVTVSVIKVWEDDNDRDGLRPDSVTVNLLANGTAADTAELNAANGWTASWTVDRYAAGQEIAYTVEEPSVPEYTSSIQGAAGLFTITNSYQPATEKLTVSKVWDDNNNADGQRPTSLKVILKGNGSFVQEAILTEAGGWQTSFEGLKVNEGGQPISYTVEEDVPAGYTPDFGGAVTLEAGEGSLEITNSYVPQFMTVHVKKIWKDNAADIYITSQDNSIRPGTIDFVLTGYVNGNVADTKTVSLDCNADYGDGIFPDVMDDIVFENVPIYIDGQKVEWVLSEDLGYGYEYYTTEITGNANTGFVVTNSFVPTGMVEVSKEWDDNNNQAGLRPSFIRIYLTADGAAVPGTETILSEQNGWYALFENLPIYREDGYTYWYNVVEEIPEDYSVQVDWFDWVDSGDWTDLGNGVDLTYNMSEQFRITNTYAPETTEVKVVKVWDDNNNGDGLRPDSVSITLWADGVAKETVEVTDGHTFTDLPKFVKGREVAYTITEAPVDNYTTSIVGEVVNDVLTYTVTNKYEPGMTTIFVQKVWNDDDDRDGKRPESVTVELQRKIGDGAFGSYSTPKTLELNEENGWSGSWTVSNVQQAAPHNPISFKVVETVPEGYEASYLVQDNTTIITNTHAPEVKSLTVTKQWYDDGNRDGIRPGSVKIHLLANGYQLPGGEVDLTEAGSWTHTWENLFVNENGEEIVYTVQEEVPAGYTLEIKEDDRGIFLKNTHKSETVTIPVTKVWNDNEDQDGVRPEEASFTLEGYVDGFAQAIITRSFTISASREEPLPISADDEGNPLYKFFRGQEVSYVLKEKAPEGYTAEINGDARTGFTVTNTHIPETRDITVTKVWEDDNNRDGLRPDTLQLNLKAGDEVVATAVLKAADGWTYTFTELPRFAEGEEIEYTVEEVSVTGYESEITGTAEEGFTITNTHEPETFTITINKIWDDDNNHDGKRPESILVTLYANGVAQPNTLSLTEAEGWTGSFENVPKYQNGSEIAYTVIEGTVADYSTLIEQTVEEGAPVFTITNSYTPGMTTVYVQKVWEDNNNQDGKRPETVEVELKYSKDGGANWSSYETPKTATLNAENGWAASFSEVYTQAKDGSVLSFKVFETTDLGGVYDVTYLVADTLTIITNTHAPEKFNVTLTKVWEDADNQDGKRPASVQVRIDGTVPSGAPVEPVVVTLSDSTWTETLELPKYINGEEVAYTVSENTVEGYTGTVDGSVEDGAITITNTHEPERITITVKKVWDDAEDQDGLRGTPAFSLYEEVDGVKAFVTGPRALADGEDTVSFKVYRYKNGVERIFSIEEEPMEGYETEVVKEAANAFTVTNTHVPETRDITISKVWKDENNQDGKRPDVIWVALYADGAVLKREALSAATGWTVTITDLPKMAAGEEIVYTVKEDKLGNGYTTKIKGNADQGFIIENSYVPETITITVNKVWDDDSNHDRKRPESVEVTLYANGAAQPNTLTITKADGWTGSFENMPKYQNGAEIVYTLLETTVPEYSTLIEQTVVEGAPVFTVTNSYTPGKTTVFVQKVWEDDDDRDGLRPESIEVELKYSKDGETWESYKEKKTATLNAENGWAASWSEVYTQAKDGSALSFKVFETEVPDGYTESYVVQDTVTIITNTHEPEVKSLKVTKQWLDDGNRDGIRPGSVKVYLVANGYRLPGGEVELTEAGSWTHTWENLFVNENGEEIVYTVQEEVPAGYTLEIKEDSRGIFLKNTHKSETVTIPVTKVWNDNEDQDGLRPDKASFTLEGYVDGFAQAIVTRSFDILAGREEPMPISADDEGDLLHKYFRGQEITYVLKEVVPEGYTEEINGDERTGFTVTNTHIPETVSVVVEKIWNDANDQDGLRPESLYIRLLADGESAGAARISAENNWEVTFADLPKFAEGTEIVYTVEEAAVQEGELEGYEAEIGEPFTDEDGNRMFVITNTHEPETFTITINKIWDDDNNHDRKRPESILVTLYANGVAQPDTLTLTAADGWSATLEDMPKFKNGAEITYTVLEGAVAEYSTLIEQTVEEGAPIFTITNSYTPGMTTVFVQKVWEDDDNRDGLRPESIEVELKYSKDGETWESYKDKKTATLNAENGWAASFSEVYTQAKDGSVLSFKVFETEVPEGYAESYVVQETVTVITNTHVPATGSLKVTKTWTDDNNRDGLKPASLTVYVKADGVRLDGVVAVLSEANEWTYTFENLPVYNGVDENGNPVSIAYSVEEEVPAGYTAEYSEESVTLDPETPAEIAITNTHTSETVQITIEKVWDDDTNRDNKRQEVTMVITGKINGVVVPELTRNWSWGTGKSHGTASQTDAGTKFAKYWNGLEVEYFVTEEGNPEEYSVTVEKLDAYTFRVTNSYEPEKRDITVKKVWEDDNDRDGLRPAYLEVTLTGSDGTALSGLLNEANGWSFTFKDLYVYTHKGQEITYTAAELMPEDLAEAYTADQAEATVDETGLVTFTNTHVPETYDYFTVEKVWVDETNRDGKRPEELTLTLYANGRIYKHLILSARDALVEENLWIRQIESTEEEPLYKFENGRPIIYDVAEEAVPDYMADKTVTDLGALDLGVVLQLNEMIFRMTNTYAPGTTTLTIMKEWIDDDNRDGLRPESVTVTLKANDGDVTAEKFLVDPEGSAELLLNEENNWTALVDVYLMAEGEELTFSVEETEVPEGYEVSYAETAGVFTVKNTHVPATGSLKVTKTWTDDNNRDGLQPASLTVYVKADGVRLDGVVAVLSEANGWSYTFENLPVYNGVDENGDPVSIAYSVEEEVPAGYTAEYSEESVTLDPETPAEIAITNTHTSETVQITIEKVWDDDTNRDNKRQEVTMVITGKINGVVVPELTRKWSWGTGKSHGTASQTDAGTKFAKYWNGLEVEYFVTEEGNPEEYSVTVEKLDAYTFRVTNSYEPEKRDITVKKVWEDDNDRDGLRPAYLEVTLTGSDGTALSGLLNEANGWSFTFKDLYVYTHKGQEITYTAAELMPEDLAEAYTADQAEATVDETGLVTFTNTHVPETYDYFTVEKVWVDETNRDGKRPETLTLTLYANGRIYKHLILDGEDEQVENTWIVRIESTEEEPLYKFENGRPIIYDVAEEAVPDYTATKDVTDINAMDLGVDVNEMVFRMTNTYAPGTTTLTIMKEWIDDDNRDGLRPDYVTVTLKAMAINVDVEPEDFLVDPTASAELLLNEENNWTALVDVYTMANGTELTFSVEETEVPEGYEVSYAETAGVFTVKNTHEIALCDIDVEKHWADNADQDGIRPGSIILRLMANGRMVADRVMQLSAANATNEGSTWTGTFTNLPVYENGEEIIYSVEEDIIDGYTPEIGYVGANHPHTHEERQWVWDLYLFGVPVWGHWETTEVVDGNPRFTIVNTHETETTSVTASKVWMDAEDQDGYRTDANSAFRLQLRTFVNGTEIAFEELLVASALEQAVIEELVTPKELPAEGETVVWEGLPKNYKGEPVEYRVVEIINEGITITIPIINYPITIGAATEAQREAAAQYEMSTEKVAENVWTVTNTHIPETINVVVEKIWNDADNQDGLRPESLYIRLLADGERVDAARISAENNWEVVFADLPKFAAGTEIVYTVEEAALQEGELDGYTAEIAEPYTDEDGNQMFVITNTHEPATMKVEVVKQWKDDDNHDQKRPNAILLTLLANGVAVDTQGVEVDGDITVFNFEDLPVFEAGKAISYAVVENPVDDYISVYDLLMVLNDETGLPETLLVGITNTYEPGVTTLTITKVWEDAYNQDGLRTDEVKVAVLADGEAAEVFGDDAEGANVVTLNAENNWTAFLNVYTMKDGKPIEAFTVEEEEVPEGYEVSYSETQGVFTVTNTHVPETTYASVTKVWEDENNRDGLRPGSITVFLRANDKRVPLAPVELSELNGWTWRWENLPVYDGVDEEGNPIPIVYSVEEVVPEGYSVEGEMAEGADGFEWTLTNTHEPAKRIVTVQKVWDDDDNRDGLRQPVTLTLVGKVNGETVVEEILEGESAEQTEFVFEDLYVNFMGSPIVWSVKEEAVEGYTTEIGGDADNGFVVTNTHEPATRNITVKKVWEDNKDQDGLRPESLTVTILGFGTLETLELNAANGWTGTFENLYVYDNGEVIEYSLTEDFVYGYTLSVYGEEVEFTYEVSEYESFITLVNTHEPEEVNVFVTKVWDDAKNQDGKRPASVNITLLANGKPVRTADISEFDEDGTGHYVFEGLPQNEDGKPISYTVAENSVPNYTTEIRQENLNSLLKELPEETLELIKALMPNIHEDEIINVFEITNHYTPEETSVTVVKTWEDENNVDGLRSDSVAVKLVAKAWVTTVETNEAGETVMSMAEEDISEKLTEANVILFAELSEANSWMHTFKNLPMYFEGAEISYTAEEAETVDGYEVKVVREGADGIFTIINTHEVERTDFTVNIKWDDSENQDGKRPAYVQVYLMKDGEMVPRSMVTITEADGWTHTWKDLPVSPAEMPKLVAALFVADTPAQDEAADIDGYTVDEVTPLAAAGYEKTSVDYDAATKTATITNSYAPETVSISGQKVWEDGHNQDGVRPEYVTVYLHADGVLVRSMTISKANESASNPDAWVFEFKDLPKYNAGRVIDYVLSEMAVPDYSLRLEGDYTLVNTYTPGKTFLTAIKIWADDRDRDGLRPDNIILRLLANGEEVSRASVSASSGWFTIWTGLPIMENGEKIVYTVVEDEVEEYDSEIAGDQENGFIVTNSHESATRSVEMKATWDDQNNASGKRPEKVTLRLVVNGVEVASKVVTADDDWKAEVEDLPMYYKGEPVKYEVIQDPIEGYQTEIMGYTANNVARCYDCRPEPKPCPPTPPAPAPAPAPVAPDTGDHSSLLMMAVVFVAAGAAFVTTLALGRRKKEQE